MTDFSPTERQGAGIRQLVEWYKGLEFGDDGKLLPTCQQTFRVFGFAGTGKAQPLDAIVWTPQGPRYMGDLAVGDEVLDVRGMSARVIGVFPQGQQEVFEVTFRDGFSTRCSGDHLWAVTNGQDERRGLSKRILTTQQIMEIGIKWPSGLYRFRIALCDPVNFAFPPPPFDPYTIGILIGDGHLKGSTIDLACCDPEIVERIRPALGDGFEIVRRVFNDVPHYNFKDIGDKDYHWNRLIAHLDRIGLQIGSKLKHIPDEYLYAPIEDRIALLQGLMDSDGSTRSNRVSFSTSSERLSRDICQLVQSLGGTAIVHKYERPSRDATEFQINIKTKFCPFSLSRKAEQWWPSEKNPPSRFIVDIKSVGYAEQQCISIDAIGSLYLTDHFIVTHNTTLTRHAIGELGLSDDFVRYAAFTGKAAHVMRRHGTPAQTIHSLIYSVIESTDEEINRAEADLAELRRSCVSVPLGTPERMGAEAALISAEQKCFDMKRPRFGLNPDSMAKDAELIVLDEVSMVGPEMAADLLSFGKPILVLGDPGQLPPIKGEGAFIMAEPDVMLTEVHRQAADSAIIRLATMAREGNGSAIAYGRHSDLVWKLERGSLSPEQFLLADQVICGLNRSRLELNQLMRRAAGFDPRSPLPVGGEKLICLKNDSARQLINGMFIGLSNPELHTYDGKINELRFNADLTNEDGEPVSSEAGRKPTPQGVYRGHFEDHVEFDEKRGERDFRLKRKMKLVEATFGWAITCHKSQGSQWQNIIVCNDGYGRTPEQRAQWAYTAITRAEEGLVILE